MITSAALADYNKALEIKPDNAGAYVNRGLAYANQGELDQAIADFSKALDLDPQYANAYHLRAIAYFGQGKFAHAWRDVKRAQILGERVDPDFLDQLRQASKSVLEDEE